MKKRSFVLLEILIAFALLSIATLPFLRFPFQHMQKEIDTLFEMELERIALNELTSLEAMLHRGEIPEKILFDKDKEPYHIAGAIEICLPGGLRRTYQKRISVSRQQQKKVGDKELASFVNLQVAFLNPKDKRKKSLKAEMQVIAQKKI